MTRSRMIASAASLADCSFPCCEAEIMTVNLLWFSFSGLSAPSSLMTHR